eukprot:c6968_g1_i2.p1 GENE.c6968_g1_i2~~c6968_g1_i2.p1  ORF type:complete len:630 (-),score=167.37 c6968_g1_i2:86-1819(-)
MRSGNGELKVLEAHFSLAVKQFECYSNNGSEYRGDVRVTTSDQVCDPWTASHLNITRFPHSGLVENFCRNPTNDLNGPWCPGFNGTQNNCNLCGNCHVGDGSMYRGTISRTIDGFDCLPWSDVDHPDQQHIPLNFPHDDLVENFCRNPGMGKHGPWCKIDPTVSGRGWQYCSVCDTPLPISFHQVLLPNIQIPQDIPSGAVRISNLQLTGGVLGTKSCGGCTSNILLDQASRWLENFPEPLNIAVLTRNQMSYRFLETSNHTHSQFSHSATIEAQYTFSSVLEGGHETVMFFSKGGCTGYFVEASAYTKSTFCGHPIWTDSRRSSGLERSMNRIDISSQPIIQSVLVPANFGLEFLKSCGHSTTSSVTLAPYSEARCIVFPPETLSVVPLLPEPRIPTSLVVQLEIENKQDCVVVKGGFRLNGFVSKNETAASFVEIPSNSWWRENVLIQCGWSTPAGQPISFTVDEGSIVYAATYAHPDESSSCGHLLADGFQPTPLFAIAQNPVDLSHHRWIFSKKEAVNGDDVLHRVLFIFPIRYTQNGKLCQNDGHSFFVVVPPMVTSVSTVVPVLGAEVSAN